jgi:Rieske Fe-S protein
MWRGDGLTKIMIPPTVCRLQVCVTKALYVAAGFNAWGISNGTAAGILIAEQILGRAPYWASVYKPTRKTPKKFNQGGDSQSLVQGLDDIKAGEGGVMNLGQGKIAVWRDADGNPRAVSASCTHKGCTVAWNNADQTWDCPCHGSIFAIDGSVIHGPAVEPLAPRKLPPNWLRHLQHSLVTVHRGDSGPRVPVIRSTPMLVGFPIAFFVATLASDLIFLQTGVPFWAAGRFGF